jgi:hypothetical protein
MSVVLTACWNNEEYMGELAGRVGVVRLSGWYRLVSAETIRTGERIFEIQGRVTAVPSRYSVQIDQDCHIDTGSDHDLQELLDQYCWRFMNHHCEPNAVIRGRTVYAIRSIRPWEEITFDYNTTEYEMAEPFPCNCGSKLCRGEIGGFKYLSAEEQEGLRPWLAPHLLRLLEPGHHFQSPSELAAVSEIS